MSRQDKLSLLFLMLFVILGAVGISLVPDRKDRQKDWNSQTKRAIPPTAGKTEQHADNSPAEAYDNTGMKDKLRPEELGEEKPDTGQLPKRSSRLEAKAGASGWLTEAEKRRARGKIWGLTVESFQQTFAQHREELFGCYEEWKESGDQPPSSFLIHLTLETLFGEPYGAIQTVSLPEVSSEKETMETCLGKVLGPILFEAPPGDKMVVNVPMNFALTTAKTEL